MNNLKILFSVFFLGFIFFVGRAQELNEKSNTPIVYSPKVVIEKMPSKVSETSGLIFFREGFWTLNDSGGDAEIYKLSPKTGRVIQVITLDKIKNIDFEDLTQDEDYVYVGDFGNNNGNRKDLCIYKIAKKDIPKRKDALVKAKRIRFKYSDQQDYTRKRYSSNFDCEAMISFDDKLYLFTKNWVNGKTKVYSVPKKKGKYSLQMIEEFAVDGLVTAADYSPDKGRLCILGYKDYMPFAWFFWDFKKDHFFNGEMQRLEFENIYGAQTEAVTSNEVGDIIISCEKSYFPQRLYQIPNKDITKKGFEKARQIVSIGINSSSKFDLLSESIKMTVNGLELGSFSVEILDQNWNSEKTISFKKLEIGTETVLIPAKRLKDGKYYLRVEQDELTKVNQIFIKR